MRKTFFAVLAASAALATTAASAAPVAVTGPSVSTPVEQVRLICNEHGRCWHARGPRYWGDRDVVVRRSYNYYDRPGYYRERGYGYGGPSVGFSINTGRW